MMLAAPLLSLLLAYGAFGAVSPQSVLVQRADLDDTFLLQVSYERRRQDYFTTSRSRVVTFRQLDGKTLLMLEVRGADGPSHRLLAAVPILAESESGLTIDLNAGFDKVFMEEDRTGEDYYGRADRQDYSFLRLFEREIVEIGGFGDTLVLKQRAIDRDREPVAVHYYLRPYRPNSGFDPVELRSLDHFGFYQAYPQSIGNRTVLYASKFDIRKPVIFALSSAIPVTYREAVRDGVLYWNRAFGKPLLQVVDAPEGVTAPNAQFNVIQWGAGGGHASTAHIQMDPRTGEILHAHIFVVPDRHQGNAATQHDYLRYLVAHEVGHALGLRHNFARGPISTVMNYFSPEEAARIGRDIIAAGRPALDYDRQVVRDVYLNHRLDIETLPAFCTDSQPGCSPFDKGSRAVGAAESGVRP